MKDSCKDVVPDDISEGTKESAFLHRIRSIRTRWQKHHNKKSKTVGGTPNEAVQKDNEEAEDEEAEDEEAEDEEPEDEEAESFDASHAEKEARNELFTQSGTLYDPVRNRRHARPDEALQNLVRSSRPDQPS